MTSYMRESDRYDSSLPSIRRQQGLLDTRHSRGISTYEEEAFDETTRTAHYRDSREPLFYQRSHSPSRQQLNSQDQARFYREELAKKDRLITQLTSLDTTPRPAFSTEATRLDELYASDRLEAAATAKSEIAGLTVRVDGLNAQVREAQAQLDIREERIRELKREVEISREQEAKNVALSASLRQKLVEYEAQYGSFEGAASRSELAISTLQNENKQLQERILELESRLRTNLQVKERSEIARSEHERKVSEIITQLRSILQLEESGIGFETVCGRVTDLVQENALMRGKLTTMKEYITSAEVENKASRETIMRLVGETERDQRSQNRYMQEMESLRAAKENAVIRQREVERELELVKERLDASQRAWNATRTELEERESHYSRMEQMATDHERQARSQDSQYRTFKDQLSQILSDSVHTVEPFEEQIRERIQALMHACREKHTHIEMLESKTSQITHQLESQFEMNRTADRRSRKVETDILELEDRLKRAEGELAAGDVLRDGLRQDKERYLRFIEEICCILKVDPITADVGLEHCVTAILRRCEQIAKNEASAIVDTKTHVYNLQRKIKGMKEQLDSKELHMDLLRKKVTSLEERLVGRSDVEREKDEEFVKNKKLVKLVEKYKAEINEQRIEIRDLKARLLETSEIRGRTMEQEKEIENLESKVGQLESVRQKQARKITGLKEEIDVTSSKLGEKSETTQNAISALSSELRTTKSALDDLTKRERQLLDLRQVLARMLGLDVNSLAVPDYEIISRLEKLILANQSNVGTVLALDSAIGDMSDGFRQGYEEAARAMTSLPRARSPSRRNSSLRQRPRSASPSKRKDPRSY